MIQPQFPNSKLVHVITEIIRRETDAWSKLDNRASQLAATLSAAPRTTVDYSVYALSFLYLYYCGNFAKGSIVGSKLQSPGDGHLTIIDLGTGSGAGLAGFVTGLAHQQALPESIRIRGLDASRAQLRLFQDLTTPYLRGQFETSVDVSLQHKDVATLSTAELGSGDYILDSYALSEMGDETVADIFDKVASSGPDGPTLLMIEPQESGLYDLARSRLGFEEIRRSEHEVNIPVPSQLQTLKMDTPVYNHGTISYTAFEPHRIAANH